MYAKKECRKEMSNEWDIWSMLAVLLPLGILFYYLHYLSEIIPYHQGIKNPKYVNQCIDCMEWFPQEKLPAHREGCLIRTLHEIEERNMIWFGK